MTSTVVALGPSTKPKSTMSGTIFPLFLAFPCLSSFLFPSHSYPIPYPKMPDLVGSIDAGTTSVRFIVFDSVATLIADHQLEFTQHFPRPGWQEQDPHEIVDKVNECISETIKKLEQEGKYSGKDIKVIGVTNQRETTVVWDKKTGKALTRAIAWPDARNTATIRKFAARSEKGVDAVKEETGLPLCEYQESIGAKRWSGTRKRRKKALVGRLSSFEAVYQLCTSFQLFYRLLLYSNPTNSLTIYITISSSPTPMHCPPFTPGFAYPPSPGPSSYLFRCHQALLDVRTRSRSQEGSR